MSDRAAQYHVVCHECRFEDLYDDPAKADRDREQHVDRHGHDVDMQGVSAI